MADGFLVMDAVYWPPAGKDDRNQPRWGQPVPIKCRWTDGSQVFTDPSGQEKTSQAFLLTDRRLAEEGLIRKGTFANLADLDSPLKNPNTYRIQKTGNVPSTDGVEEDGVYFAWL
jgi:hypothetical protein